MTILGFSGIFCGLQALAGPGSSNKVKDTRPYLEFLTWNQLQSLSPQKRKAYLIGLGEIDVIFAKHQAKNPDYARSSPLTDPLSFLATSIYSELLPFTPAEAAQKTNLEVARKKLNDVNAAIEATEEALRKETKNKDNAQKEVNIFKTGNDESNGAVQNIADNFNQKTANLREIEKKISDLQQQKASLERDRELAGKAVAIYINDPLSLDPGTVAPSSSSQPAAIRLPNSESVPSAYARPAADVNDPFVKRAIGAGVRIQAIDQAHKDEAPCTPGVDTREHCRGDRQSAINELTDIRNQFEKRVTSACNKPESNECRTARGNFGYADSLLKDAIDGRLVNGLVHDNPCGITSEAIKCETDPNRIKANRFAFYKKRNEGTYKHKCIDGGKESDCFESDHVKIRGETYRCDNGEKRCPIVTYGVKTKKDGKDGFELICFDPKKNRNRITECRRLSAKAEAEGVLSFDLMNKEHYDLEIDEKQEHCKGIALAVHCDACKRARNVATKKAIEAKGFKCEQLAPGVAPDGAGAAAAGAKK
jgi:hypothetical protein